MKNNLRRLLEFFLLIVIFFIGLSLSITPPVDDIERSLIDWRYRTTYLLGKSPDFSQDIVLVLLDEETVCQLKTICPFPREALSNIIVAVNDLGAKTIALDILLDFETNQTSDSILEATIKEAGNVITPGMIEYEENRPFLREPLSLFTNNLWQPNFTNLSKATYQKRFAISELVDGETVFFFPIVVIASFMNLDPMEFISKREFNLRDLIYINYAGPSEVIKGFSASLLLLENKPPRSFFENKLVIIGAEHKDARDYYFMTPYSRNFLNSDINYMTGVKIIANATNTILKDNPIKPASSLFTFTIAVVLAFIAFLVFRKIKLYRGVIVFLLGILIINLLSLYLFVNQDLIVNMSMLFISLTSGIISVIIVRFVDTRTKAIIDKNTNLYNRGYLWEYLAIHHHKALKRGTALTVIMFDIDFFKSFNDTYGHDIGDIVLRRVSSVMKDEVSKIGIVARYGGEELTVVLPGGTPGIAFEIAESIRLKTSSLSIQVKGEKIKGITISGGISGGVDLAPTIEELIKEADIAMYKAKESGRNRNIVFVKDFNSKKGE